MKGIDVNVVFFFLAGSGYKMYYKEGADLINNSIKTKNVVPYHLLNQASANEFAKLIKSNIKYVIYNNGKAEKIIN